MWRRIDGAFQPGRQRGEAPYTQDTLEAFAVALGVQPADLLAPLLGPTYRDPAVGHAQLPASPRVLIGSRRIATISLRLARTLAEDMPLRVVPIARPLLKISVHSQWREHRDNDHGLRWLREALRVEAAELGRDQPERLR